MEERYCEVGQGREETEREREREREIDYTLSILSH